MALLTGKPISSFPQGLREEVEDLIRSTALPCSLAPGWCPGWKGRGRRRVPSSHWGWQRRHTAPAGWRQRPPTAAPAAEVEAAISLLRGRGGARSNAVSCGKGHPVVV